MSFQSTIGMDNVFLEQMIIPMFTAVMDVLLHGMDYLIMEIMLQLETTLTIL
jgi:hypothetical protein